MGWTVGRLLSRSKSGIFQEWEGINWNPENLREVFRNLWSMWIPNLLAGIWNKLGTKKSSVQSICWRFNGFISWLQQSQALVGKARMSLENEMGISGIIEVICKLLSAWKGELGGFSLSPTSPPGDIPKPRSKPKPRPRYTSLTLNLDIK